MKKLLLLILACAGLYAHGFAQLALQDFESTTATTLPTGWTQVNTGTGSFVGWFTGTNLTLSSSFFAPPAHTRFVAVNDNAAGANGDNSNDLLSSPNFSLVTVAHPFLSYDVYYLAASSATIHESLQVVVSTNGGSSWTTIYTDPGITSNSWATRLVDLTSFAANMSNVQIGFRYSDDHQWLNGAALDNIKVTAAPAAELGLTKIFPDGSTPTNYAAVNSTLPIGGTAINNGYAPVTAFTVFYQLGNGAVFSEVKTGLNIASFATYSFTITSPLAIPSAVNTYPLKIWIQLSGDTNPANDTLSTTIISTAFMPSKKLAFEQSLSTSCGECVRGIVYSDSLWKTYRNSVSIVNIHHADPMAVPAYDNFLTTYINGTALPAVSVDRREIRDAGTVFDIFNKEYNYFGYASVLFGTSSVNGNNLTLPVTIIPAIDLNGDYRLMLTLTEDNVTGTSGSYDQANAYSYAAYGNTIPLSEPGYDYLNLPGTIPAAQMQYNFVARNVLPSPAGTAGVLPSTMSNNTNYNYTFTTTIDSSWKNLRAVVLLIRNADGQILNSNYTTLPLPLPLGISNIATGIQHLAIFPNPARDAVSVRFNLNETTELSLTVNDAMGRNIYQKNCGMMSAEEHLFNIPTTDFAAGIYYLNVWTSKGNSAGKFTVVH